MTCTRPKVVVCDFVDIKVLVAKEGYAPSVTPSPFKRHGGLKILLLTKVKSFRKITENFAESKKSIIFVVSIKKGGKYEKLEFLLRQRKKGINFNFVEQKKEIINHCNKKPR